MKEWTLLALFTIATLSITADAKGIDFPALSTKCNEGEPPACKKLAKECENGNSDACGWAALSSSNLGRPKEWRKFVERGCRLGEPRACSLLSTKGKNDSEANDDIDRKIKELELQKAEIELQAARDRAEGQRQNTELQNQRSKAVDWSPAMNYLNSINNSPSRQPTQTNCDTRPITNAYGQIVRYETDCDGN